MISTTRSRNQNKNTPVEELCFKLPKEFVKYLNYWRSLNFEDKPCISDLIRLLKKLSEKKGYDKEGKFDWINKKEKIPSGVEGGGEENDDEEPDYKKKLKEILDKKKN